MPELRRDPVVGYWTIISTERSRRPIEYKGGEIIEERECPFCEGRESETTKEIYAVRKEGSEPNGPGWLARVVTSKVPILSPEAHFDRYGQGIYDLMQGVGRHEVIIESPRHDHSLDQLEAIDIAKVIQVYVRRMNELEKDTRFRSEGDLRTSRFRSTTFMSLRRLPPFPRPKSIWSRIARCATFWPSMSGRRSARSGIILILSRASPSCRSW